jgi:hypothetical protein
MTPYFTEAWAPETWMPSPAEKFDQEDCESLRDGGPHVIRDTPNGGKACARCGKPRPRMDERQGVRRSR